MDLKFTHSCGGGKESLLLNVNSSKSHVLFLLSVNSSISHVLFIVITVLDGRVQLYLTEVHF